MSSHVGNDVVDLGDPVTASAHLRPRFVARVCTETERGWVQSAPDPATLLWSLFAAKEAAYKVLIKLRPGVVFAHRQFCVAGDLRSVGYRGLALALRLDCDGERVHAVAIAGDADPGVVAEVARVPAGADLGRAARDLLCGTLARRWRRPAGGLAVVRPPLAGGWDGYGPPRLHCGGVAVAVDVSLSHDGRFVAFAAAGGAP